MNECRHPSPVQSVLVLSTTLLSLIPVYISTGFFVLRLLKGQLPTVTRLQRDIIMCPGTFSWRGTLSFAGKAPRPAKYLWRSYRYSKYFRYKAEFGLYDTTFNEAEVFKISELIGVPLKSHAKPTFSLVLLSLR